MNEFVKRTITAFFLIIIAFVLIKFLPLIYFSIILFLLISGAAYEFISICNPEKYSYFLVFLTGIIVALSFTFKQPDLKMTIIIVVFLISMFFLFRLRQKQDLVAFIRDIGIHFLIVFYIYIPLYFLFELKRIGPNYLFFLIFVIAIGDSGAYFLGSVIGKHKIYPVASPKKSLEGLIAAIVFASVSGWLSKLIFPVDVTLWVAVVTGGIIGLISQLSDPVESLFKRAANKKDSGTILPGHGGILDRVDSYIFCAPALFYIIEYFWK